METAESERIREEKETERLEFFSDAVFAVAITLLVLEIKVPQHVEGSLLAALGHEWPMYIAYVTSFATILIMWVNHHNLFRQIVRSDHTFLLLNGRLMFGVTLIPFPTALIAEYIRQPQARTAAVVYAGAFLMIAIFFTVLWLYAAHDNRLLARDADRAFVANITRQFRIGPILYVVAVALAFINAIACFVYLTLLAVYFALPKGIASLLHPSGRRASRGEDG